MALLFPTLQFLDPNYTSYARPLALGKIYTYEAGTTTPKATYTDSTEGTSHANPIILNSNGQPEVSGSPKGIWLSSDGLYKIVIKNAAGTTLQEIDNTTGLGSTLTFFSTLSANLDMNGYSLVTTSVNQDITIQPNGTGKSKIYGLQPQDDVDMNGQDILMDSGSAIMDDSSNEYIKFAKTATAVNEITITNAATGAGPTISVTGGDTNADLNISSKGTGAINLSAGTGSVLIKGNATQAGELRIAEDTDNGTNYSTVRPAQSLANNSGILTLPTVAMTCPTALPASTELLTYSSAGVMSTSPIAYIYLGTLNSGNSFASTSILTGYSSYICFINYLLQASTTNTYLAIQLYCNGAYVTSNYSNGYYGVNNSGGTAVQGTAAATSSWTICPTTSGGTTPSIYSGYFIICANSGGTLIPFNGSMNTFQSAGAQCSISTGGYVSSITSPLTGMKVISGAGSVNSGSISVYGIPS